MTQETNQLVAAVKEEQKRNASALFLNSTYRHSRFSGTYVSSNKVQYPLQNTTAVLWLYAACHSNTPQRIQLQRYCCMLHAISTITVLLVLLAPSTV